MSSIEALWTVRFGAVGADVSEMNGGVAVMESGRMFGGDSAYAYLGKFNIEGSKVTGTLTIIRHNFSPDFASIYGTNEKHFPLTFSSTRVGDDRIVGRLQRKGYPDADLVLDRLSSLP
jgi:hypothetical protein